MRCTLACAITALTATLSGLASAQQYAGDVIDNNLPSLPGAEITYFRIKDPQGKNNNLTLTNYYNHDTQGKRLTDSELQRAVIIIHGLNRDPGTYESNMLSALSQVDPSLGITQNNVAIMAPYFASGNDKQGNTDQYGFPWTDGLKAGRGSTSNCLVWKGSQWSAGGNAQYPKDNENTISSYYVLDELVKYFDNIDQFPKMKQIVVAGHSLGGQMVQRYSAIGNNLGTRVPVTHYVGNPNSYVWLSQDRPLSTSSCSIFDDYREGFSNFVGYPMTYGVDLVNSGREAILANYQSKQIAYGRALQDIGDASSSCAAGTTGSNRNERFFNFIKAFPPSCPDPSGRNCDTVDYVNTGHDGGAMFASKAGQARLFIDNWNGDGKRAYDVGQRQQGGDNPYPDPDIVLDPGTVDDTVYAGNQTYQGCWTDQDPRSLSYMIYDNSENSAEKCTSACAAAGYTISGTEYGSQCFCGNTLTSKATQVIKSSCQMSCPGSPDERCGGNNRMSLYSNGIPQLQPEPSNREQVGNFFYQRCVTEGTSSRALTGKSTSAPTMTLEVCAKFCAGSKYMALSYGSECYCGSSVAAGAAEVVNSQCSMTCAADPTEFCGAGYRYSLYMDYDVVVSSIPAATSTPSSTRIGASTATTTGSTTKPSTGGSSPTSTPLTCPASNDSIYVAENGETFKIECDIDHQGGDMASLGVASFKDCIDACAAREGCVDVSLSGSACYLKSSLGASLNFPGILGAKLIAAVSTSSTVSSESSTAASTSTASVPSSIATSASTSSSTSSSATQSSASTATSSQESSSSLETLSSSTESSNSPSTSSVATSSSLANTLSASTSSASSSSSSAGVTSDSASSLSSTVSDIPTSSTSSASISSGVSSSSDSTSQSSTSSVSPSSSAEAIPSSTSSSSLFSLSSSTESTTSSSTSSVASVVSESTATTVPSTSSSEIGTSSSASIPVASPSTVSTTPSSVASTSTTSTSSSTTSSTLSSAISPTSSSTSSSATTLTTTSSSSTTKTSSTSSSTSTTSSSTVTPALPTGFSSVGCYKDGSSRALPVWGGSSSSQTPSLCAQTCSDKNMKFSGVEYGVECYCSENAPSTEQVDAKECSFACPGDKSQKCGAGYRLSVVVEDNFVSRFNAVQNYTTWNLVDCYMDNTLPRTLGSSVSLAAYGGPSNATVGNCLDACKAKGYKNCGVEYAMECWGSNTAPTKAVAPGANPLAAGCNMPCKGASSTACGGSGKLLVYINNGTAIPV